VSEAAWVKKAALAVENTAWDAQVAQLVEQWTENPRVVGSIPTLGTNSDKGGVLGFVGAAQQRRRERGVATSYRALHPQHPHPRKVRRQSRQVVHVRRVHDVPALSSGSHDDGVRDASTGHPGQCLAGNER
jgi:hypothetical protein